MPGGFAAFMGSPAGGAAIQGGFSVGGNLFSAREAKKQNRRNLKLYRENRAWEEEMANTEWTRGVADMLNAGINPMLAVSQGGASTPSVAAPHVEKEEGLSRVSESVGKNPATLLAMQQLAANIKLTNANAYKTEKEGDIAAFNAFPDIIGPLNDVKMKQLNADYELTELKKKMTQMELDQLEKMMPIALRLEGARAKLTEEQSTSAAQTRRLEAYTEDELKATAQWFKSMGASGRVMEFIQRAISIMGRN